MGLPSRPCFGRDRHLILQELDEASDQACQPSFSIGVDTAQIKHWQIAALSVARDGSERPTWWRPSPCDIFTAVLARFENPVGSGNLVTTCTMHCNFPA